jgi:hypothetical protein
MSDTEAKVRLEFAHHYLRLRRSFWRAWLAGIGSFFAAGLPLILFGHYMSDAVCAILGVTLFAIFIPSWISGVIAATGISGLRCPRCQKKFGASRSSFATEKCQNCGLDIGPEIAAAS